MSSDAKRKKEREESLGDMFAWLEEEYPWATGLVDNFIAYEGKHPYEEASELQKEIRGIKNQHDLPRAEGI